MTAQERLKKLHRDVDQIIQFISTIDNHADVTLNWKSSPDQWSILECIEHLNLYNRFYNVEIASVINSATHGEPTNRSSWLGRKFIAMMHPDNRKKQKTMKHLNPIHSNLNVAAIHEFISHQNLLLNMIATCGSKSIEKESVRVEFFKLLRMPLLDAIEFVVVHEQRHILQVKGILQKRLNQEAVLKV